LLEQHGAEQVAAAFLRQYRVGHSAPEDLLDVPAEGERKKPRRDEFAAPRDETPFTRTDFTDGVWVSLSVGRKQNAEPRWLIPMLCRNGNLTKRDIGAIKMQPEETFVEFSAEGAERFLTAIGPDKTLERGIRVKPLAGMPDFSQAKREGTYGKKKPFADKAPRPQEDGKPKWKSARKPERTQGGEGAVSERPGNKPWAKKPGKPSFAKNDGPPPAGKPNSRAKRKATRSQGE
jgi:ATP-dependent RNA helicase DeaD